jgi:hypothetical protein
MHVMAVRGRRFVAPLLIMIAALLLLAACGAAGTPAPALPTAPPNAPTTAPALLTTPPAAPTSAPVRPTTPPGAPTSAPVRPTTPPGAPTSAPVRPANTVPGAAPKATTAALNCTEQETPAAAVPVATPLPSELTAAQSAYLDSVDALVNRLSGSTEIQDAILAMRDVTQSYGLSKTFDAQTSNQKVSQAAAFMSKLASDVNALQPPPMFKSVQDELQGAIDTNNTFLKDSTTALNSPSSETMGTVQVDLLGPMLASLPVTLDSSTRRSKAGMGLPQIGVDSPLTPGELAYLNQVQALVTRMSNCPELSAALAAFGDDLDTLNNTGQLDGKSSSDARAASIRFMNALAPAARALQPPARLLGVQDELLRAVGLYSNGFNDWQTAIVDQKWDKLGSAFFDEVGSAGAILNILNKDLAFLGVK